MNRCVQPGLDLFGCPYYAHGSEPLPQLCYWHAKKLAGLFTCPAKGCARPIGHRPPCSGVSADRRTVSDDQLFSDEHLQILALLRGEVDKTERALFLATFRPGVPEPQMPPFVPTLMQNRRFSQARLSTAGT